jgi:hypothetical protein
MLRKLALFKAPDLQNPDLNYELHLTDSNIPKQTYEGVPNEEPSIRENKDELPNEEDVFMNTFEEEYPLRIEQVIISELLLEQVEALEEDLLNKIFE